MHEAEPCQDVRFDGQSFCFTGTLSELKRTQAERETRARGGLTSKTVNRQLDYLVVGSIPSPGWKHGDYGNKIATAIELHREGSDRPQLIPESSFMLSLAKTPPANSGAIDGKVAVVVYTFAAPSRNAFDRGAVEALLHELRDAYGCHIRPRVTLARVRNELFAGRGQPLVPDGYLVFEIRIVRHARLEESTSDLADRIASRFEAIHGIDGRINWFDRVEGSADYIRLVREIPEDLLLPDV